jgi:hypothetical protein
VREETYLDVMKAVEGQTRGDGGICDHRIEQGRQGMNRKIIARGVESEREKEGKRCAIID